MGPGMVCKRGPCVWPYLNFLFLVYPVQVCSYQGRGRMFLRIALQRKILTEPIEHLIKNNRLLSVSILEVWKEFRTSVIGITISSSCLKICL